jgi:NAD(P)H-hydrate epimerase
MELLASAEQMRRFDLMAVRSLKMPPCLLMENAGRGVADLAETLVGDGAEQSILILCGRGNNGGDGLVAGRHLYLRGYRVDIILVAKRNELKGDARANLLSLLRMNRAEPARLRLREMTAFSARKLGHPVLVIDAMFGTGFTGGLSGIHTKIAAWVNGQKCPVLSIDVPSGVNAADGRVETTAVNATHTVTMGAAKVGHYVGRGRDHSGEVTVTDIGVPARFIRPIRRQVYLVNATDVRNLLPRRGPRAHKYSVGKVFVLAGSRGLTGAPFMTALSAMKSGAGAVVLGVPAGIHPMLARKLTEAMVTPLEETDEGTVSIKALRAITEKTDWADVVVIGPGLTRSAETQELILHVLRHLKKPLILDADALSVVRSARLILRKRKEATIVTPHVGEMSVMTGWSPEKIETFRVNAAQDFASSFRLVVALKGSPTVTASPSGSTWLNSSGNPGMATAGAGDVLTGVIGGLMAQGMKAEHATVSGVFLHGLAGDLAASRFGQRAMMATDIIDQITGAFAQVETN